MNNRWLVWQIRRGQASVEENRCVVVRCAGYMSAEQREDAGDTDFFYLLQVHLRSKIQTRDKLKIQTKH